MTLQKPSGSRKADLESLISSYPTWAHPDVLYYENDWRMIRCAYEGERAIKNEGELLLPKMASMDSDQYELFLQNATFFNMVARTVGALAGTLFHRNPVIDGLKKEQQKNTKTITKRGQTLRSFTQEITREILQMGRVGVLVDTTDGGSPYLCMYVTESIVDWESSNIDGREQLTKVILMEMVEKESEGQMARTFEAQFRVLVLEDGVYKQKIYKNTDGEVAYPSLEGDPTETIIPTKSGVSLKQIPFRIMGPTASAWDVQRSPMLDIAGMNISHYRSYAQLEHGRYYTGFPVYWASKGSADQSSEYRLGPDVVWEVPSGEKAGLLEFNGQGLKFLENAIETKQGHIASLGGRMIGVETQATAESDNQVNMKDRNEQALLFEMSISLDEGFTAILAIWAEWDGMTKAAAALVNLEFNKDFILKEVAAREFRAIQSMWKDGLLPLDVVYDYLKKAEVIPDWMELEEFKKLLETTASFPNNPDIDAKSRGFADAKAEQQSKEAELARKQETEEAKKDREAAEKAAAETAKAAADANKMEIKPDKEADTEKPKVDEQGRRVRNQQDLNRK
jgi:hypothetical protein